MSGKSPEVLAGMAETAALKAAHRAELGAKALKLRADGMTWEAIGRRLGISGPSAQLWAGRSSKGVTP